MLVGELVDIGWVATIAGATSLAVDDDLSAKADWAHGLEVVQDVEAISKSRG